MSENLPPKKPRRKSTPGKKVNINVKKRWQDIVRAVDKKEVPVDVLERIVVKLIDGTDLSIDIKQLLADGQHADDIEELLNTKFADLDEFIDTVDFFIDLDKVVNTVQPATDKMLKNL
jgi:uncharacterized membrane-anchored protein YjiN (DUF445 family)